MSPLASTLPANDGYVAAAYIVFVALLLIYVTIMAIRTSRMERRLRELQGRRAQEAFAERRPGERGRGGADGEGVQDRAGGANGPGEMLEREPV